MRKTTIAQAGATGARVLMKGALASVFVLVAALKTSASTSLRRQVVFARFGLRPTCTQDSDQVGINEANPVPRVASVV